MTMRQQAKARYPDLHQNIAGISEPGTGREVAVIDPTTEQVLGHYNEVSQEALDRALNAAREGFRVWKATSAVQRGRILHKVANTMRDRAEMLAEPPLAAQRSRRYRIQLGPEFAQMILQWGAGHRQRTLRL